MLSWLSNVIHLWFIMCACNFFSPEKLMLWMRHRFPFTETTLAASAAANRIDLRCVLAPPLEANTTQQWSHLFGIGLVTNPSALRCFLAAPLEGNMIPQWSHFVGIGIGCFFDLDSGATLPVKRLWCFFPSWCPRMFPTEVTRILHKEQCNPSNDFSRRNRKMQGLIGNQASHYATALSHSRSVRMK